MLLRKTRKRLIYRVKLAIFESGNFQEMLDLRDKYRLEDSMGFRGQFDEHRRFQFDLLKRRGLLPHHRLLEIGCGPLTGGLPLIGYLNPGNYTGVDVRDSVLNLAWKEVGKAGLSARNPRLIQSSSFGSNELRGQQFDFVLSFSVLYHLSDEILASYLAAVRERLNATGQCLANVNTQDASSTWLEFPFLRRTIEDYENLARSKGLETSRLGELAELGFLLPGIERRNQMLAFRPTSVPANGDARLG